MTVAQILLAIGLGAGAIAILRGMQTGKLGGQKLILLAAAWILFAASLIIDIAWH
jgi:hypothetical protein